MKPFIAAALAASTILSPAAMAAEIDPGYGVNEPTRGQIARRNGLHPIAAVLFAPLMPFVQLQSELSPDKASCFNDVPGDVVGCGIAEQASTVADAVGDAIRVEPYAN